MFKPCSSLSTKPALRLSFHLFDFPIYCPISWNKHLSDFYPLLFSIKNDHVIIKAGIPNSYSLSVMWFVAQQITWGLLGFLFTSVTKKGWYSGIVLYQPKANLFLNCWKGGERVRVCPQQQHSSRCAGSCMENGSGGLLRCATTRADTQGAGEAGEGEERWKGGICPFSSISQFS